MSLDIDPASRCTLWSSSFRTQRPGGFPQCIGPFDIDSNSPYTPTMAPFVENVWLVQGNNDPAPVFNSKSQRYRDLFARILVERNRRERSDEEWQKAWVV